MIGPKATYCMYMSFAGCLYFIFITFACFFGMEVLKLKEGTRVARGFTAFLVAIVNILIYIIFFSIIQIYGGIGGYIYYKKYNEEERLKIYYNIEQEDAKLKNRLKVDY